MSRIVRLALIPLCLTVIGSAFWTVQIVKVTLPKENDRLIAAVHVTTNDIISLIYTHSVEHTKVEGRFKVGPESEIIAIETRMESVGTGLPNAFPERTHTKDGWLVVDEGQRPVGPIRFFMVPLNKSRLTIADRLINTDSLKTGTLIQVSAERLFLISWVWKAATGFG